MYRVVRFTEFVSNSHQFTHVHWFIISLQACTVLDNNAYPLGFKPFLTGKIMEDEEAGEE